MKKNFLNFASFLVFTLAAILIFIKDLLPHVGVSIGGSFFTALEVIKDVLLFLIIGISAFRFIQTKKKGWKIFFIVMLAIFIGGIILRIV